jgi:hypothetical protein
VDLHELSGVFPLIGLGLATVGGDQNKGGINPIDDLSIDLLRAGDGTANCSSGDGNGGTSTDLWKRDGVDSSTSVNLAAGSSATLCIRFLRELKPDEYSIPIQVTALNATADSAHTITIGLNVTRSQIWPFMTLLLSVLFSYGLTKVIRTQLQQSALEKRITKIQNQAWYRKNWHIVPMVQVKAMLNQVSKAMEHKRWGKRFFFPASLVEYVTNVENRLRYLKRLTELKSYWDRSNEDQLLINRANKELGSITYALNETPLDEDVDASVVTHLSTLEEWRDSTKLRGHYWNSLYGDILTITRQINWHAFASENFDQFLAELDQYRDSDGVRALLDETRVGIDTLKSSAKLLTQQQQKLLTNAGAAVKRLTDDFATVMAESYLSVRRQLEVIGEEGPEPAIGAVETLRRQMNSSALQARLSELAKLLDALNDGTITDPDSDQKLAEHLNSFKMYREDVLNQLTSELEPVLDKQNVSDRETLRKLVKALRPDEAPKNLSEALERERCYCKVKLIVQASKTVRTELLDAERRKATLSEMFEIMDDSAWQLIGKGISLSAVPKTPSAFDLIEFSVTAEDYDAANTFLFKHGLTYRWRVWFKKPNKDDDKPDLDVTTDGPQVSQFIPRETPNPVVAVSAKYRHRTDSIEAKLDKGLSVSSARIFGIVSAFERVELAALGLAIVAALGTGMQSQQYEAAINGSLSAYFVLIVWGFATDQLKNVLENIKTITSPDG